ncbi:hypothetical protein [Methylomonas methanica]|uniref:Uncharacterized protein n=1 Tax=Methylomonas methanica (strain DSM 25384 / MC09) TaxID=857087 RepID=G0A4T7_METMM|nr:hypothetical protein [Methylomonas methanica]AEG02828.1 hypothetical protein Metme_4488 [Methylomonas methanica MC09]
MEKQSTTQEFHRGQQIMLQLSLTREQCSALAEWSASIPTLYFLDICVVGATKLTDNALETNPRKLKLVSHLRELDKPQNCFSYLCALMEKVSDSREKITDAELEKQLISDLFALRAFFKNASVYEPDEFIISFLRELRGSAIEVKRPNYLELLEAANGRFALKDSTSQSLRLEKANKIVNEAESLEISKQHPVVITMLACLYGNSAAKNLMKFKADPDKFEAENTLADIMAISRFSAIKLQIECLGRNGRRFLRSDFITDDNGLSELIKCYKPSFVKHDDTSDGRETQLSFDVDLKRILTEIQADEYEKIYDLLS